MVSSQKQAIKKIILFAFVITLNSGLLGCATQYHRGDGVIIAEKKLKDRDYKPHVATKTGAIVGGTIGAVGGAAAGGFLGLCLGALSGVGGPMLVVTTLGGAAIGSIVVGAAGGTVGGGLGYAVDVATPGAATYQFVVKSNNESQPLVITQYTHPIPLHSQVSILEKDNVLSIKQK